MHNILFSIIHSIGIVSLLPNSHFHVFLGDTTAFHPTFRQLVNRTMRYLIVFMIGATIARIYSPWWLLWWILKCSPVRVLSLSPVTHFWISSPSSSTGKQWCYLANIIQIYSTRIFCRYTRVILLLVSQQKDWSWLHYHGKLIWQVFHISLWHSTFPTMNPMHMMKVTIYQSAVTLKARFQ